MKYKVAWSDSAEDLEAEVQELVDAGYRPVGGVAVVRYEFDQTGEGYMATEWRWAQALTLEVK